MEIQYNLTPTNILNILGFNEPKSNDADTYLENFENKCNLKIPINLKSFMKLAINNPLFETADIWTDSDSLWTFLYDEIEAMNEDEEEYPEFINTPKEKWNNLVSNYLEIGSDYGAGVVTFGICVNDMDKENPPVYMNNEDDEITEWNKMWNSISDYLMTVICDALVGFGYDTTTEFLEEHDWNCNCYEDSNEVKELLKKYDINVSLLQKVTSNYLADPDNEYLACCYDKKDNMLFVFHINEDNIKVYTYCKDLDC